MTDLYMLVALVFCGVMWYAIGRFDGRQERKKSDAEDQHFLRVKIYDLQKKQMAALNAINLLCHKYGHGDAELTFFLKMDEKIDELIKAARGESASQPDEIGKKI